MEYTHRDEQLKKELITRINKISGQVEGIKKMILDDRYCKDILTQIKACSKSLKSLSNLIFNNHLENCVVNKIKNGDTEVLKEIAELLRQEL